MAREGSRQGRKRGKASAAAESESPTSAAPVSSATEAEVAGLYEAAAAQGDGKEKKKTGGKGTGSPPAFDPRQLDSTVIALPLLAKMVGKGEEPLPSRRRGRAQAEDEEPRGLKAAYDVIIDLNLDYPGDRSAARAQVEKLIDELLQEHGIGKGDQGIYPWKAERSRQYVFAKLRGDLIQLLVQRDRAAAADGPEGKPMAAIYRIWPDFKVQALTTKSISTVKADAARNAFAATGAGIVWAVLDSGVDGHHPHFALHRSLELDPAMQHHDFTAMENLAAPESRARALSDLKGHGTHVAGIIAGQSVGTRGVNIMAEKNEVDQDGVSRPVEFEP